MLTVFGVIRVPRSGATMRTPQPAMPCRFGLERTYAAAMPERHEVASRECLAVVLHADCRMRSIVNGRESVYELDSKMVGVVPPDQARHTVVVTARRPTSAFLLLFPREIVGDVLRSEGLQVDACVGDEMTFVDRGMHALLCRVRDRSVTEIASSDALEDDVRQLLLGAVRWLSGAVPDWMGDTSRFVPHAMRFLTDMVDASLVTPPRLSEIALLMGCTPGHCGRKLRLTTGLTLEQFVNYRRVVAALRLLRQADEPLAGLSLELGYSSQSHFTSTFRTFTGMTPGRYRRESRRVMG